MINYFESEVKHHFDNLTDALFNLKEEHVLSKWLRSSPNIRILDVGCGYPQTLINLYYGYNCKNILGIEERTEKWCVKSIFKRTEDSKYKMCDNFYDLYKMQAAKGECPVDRETFNEEFRSRIKFETEIEEYLNSEPGRFDFIILSNVLNWIPDFDTFFQEILTRLEDDGLVYVRFNNVIEDGTPKEESYEDVRIKVREMILKSRFKKGTIHEHVENGDWESTVFMNIDL